MANNHAKSLDNKTYNITFATGTMNVPTDPAGSGIKVTTMELLKITILGIMAVAAIILLFCESERIVDLIATKAAFFVLAYVIARMWKTWRIENKPQTKNYDEN